MVFQRQPDAFKIPNAATSFVLWIYDFQAEIFYGIQDFKSASSLILLSYCEIAAKKPIFQEVFSNWPGEMRAGEGA
jgi:hypothetical protein